MSNEKKQEQDSHSVMDIKGKFPETAWVLAVTVGCLLVAVLGVVIELLLVVVMAVAMWVVLMVIGVAWKATDDHSIDAQKQRRLQGLTPTVSELDRLAATPAERTDTEES